MPLPNEEIISRVTKQVRLRGSPHPFNCDNHIVDVLLTMNGCHTSNTVVLIAGVSFLFWVALLVLCAM